MAVVKKHWKLLVLQVIVITTVVVCAALFLQRSPAQAEPPVPTAGVAASIDPLCYARVMKLREQFGLSSESLAVAGCDGAAAKQLFQQMVVWCNQNKGAIDSAEVAETAAQREIAEAIRQINVGGSNANALKASLPALAQRLRAAAEARHAVYQSGFESVGTAKLSAAQRTRLATMRISQNMPGDLRFVTDLSTTERKQIAGTIRQFGSDSQEFIQLRSFILTGQRGAEVTGARAMLAQNAVGVCAAEHEVLPLPISMRR